MQKQNVPDAPDHGTITVSSNRKKVYLIMIFGSVWCASSWSNVTTRKLCDSFHLECSLINTYFMQSKHAVSITNADENNPLQKMGMLIKSLKISQSNNSSSLNLNLHMISAFSVPIDDVHCTTAVIWLWIRLICKKRIGKTMKACENSMPTSNGFFTIRRFHFLPVTSHQSLANHLCKYYFNKTFSCRL